MADTHEMFLWRQTYATLFSLSNKLQIDGDRYLGILTSRQLMTMIAIIHLPKEQTSLNAIARKLGTTKQNVKQLVTALEKKNLIIMKHSDSDKRACTVEITEHGKEVLLESNERGMSFFAEIFKDFSTDELETFWGFMKKLYRYDAEEQDGFEENATLN